MKRVAVTIVIAVFICIVIWAFTGCAQQRPVAVIKITEVE